MTAIPKGAPDAADDAQAEIERQAAGRPDATPQPEPANPEPPAAPPPPARAAVPAETASAPAAEPPRSARTPDPAPPRTAEPPPASFGVASAVPAQPFPPAGASGSQAPQAAPAVPVTLPPAPVARPLADALKAAPCSFVAAEETGRLLTFKGVMGPGTDAASLRAMAQEAAPGKALDLQVDTVLASFCSLLDVLRAGSGPTGGPARPLTLTLAEGRTSLRAGDLVQPRLRLPDTPSHLQLDYVASDGSVLHMHDSRPGTPYGAAATPNFGTPRAGFRGWAVDEPFGTDVIVAIATPSPMFGAGQALAETVDDYAAQIKAALAAGSKVEVTVLPVRTRPK